MELAIPSEWQLYRSATTHWLAENFLSELSQQTLRDTQPSYVSCHARARASFSIVNDAEKSYNRA